MVKLERVFFLCLGIGFQPSSFLASGCVLFDGSISSPEGKALGFCCLLLPCEKHGRADVVRARRERVITLKFPMAWSEWCTHLSIPLSLSLRSFPQARVDGCYWGAYSRKWDFELQLLTKANFKCFTYAWNVESSNKCFAAGGRHSSMPST